MAQVQNLEMEVRWMNEKKFMAQVHRAQKELEKLSQIKIEIEVIDRKKPWYKRLWR